MIKFYLTISIELLFSPFLLVFEEIKKYIGKFIGPRTYRVNPKKIDNEVLFVIHEWAGYPFVRQKTIKYVNHTFTCGLKYHFDRLSKYQGDFKIRKILTISAASEEYIHNLNQQDFCPDDLELHQVENNAMDFSGYNYAITNFLDNSKDQIVFLTNSSVDSTMVDFIDQHVNLFQNNSDLGVLGVSYSTKVYQTPIRNNFRPHLQSFFLVTRSGILQELLLKNGGHLPGSTESYKLSIIRFGEVKITEMIQKLGYRAAVITAEGILTTLPDFGTFYNGYYKWKLPRNDYRLSAKRPNIINVLRILLLLVICGLYSFGCRSSPRLVNIRITTDRHEYDPLMDVKSFGAKGDGRTDDTKALQLALDRGAGRTIFFPKGNYLISKSLLVESGTELLGEGDVGGLAGSSILTGASNHDFAIFSSRTNQLSNVIFRNIRTLRARYSLSMNVRGGHLTKIKWYNCVFQQHEICINVYGSNTNGMYANTFRDCYFVASKTGIYCQGPYNINIVQGCGFENMDECYLELSNESSSNLSNSFLQNRCESVANKNGTGIKLGKNVFGFYINGNFFENSFKTIFKTNGARNVDFSNNTYTGNGPEAAGNIQINGGDAVIRNNISLTGFSLDITPDGICTELSANTFLDFSNTVKRENLKRVSNDYNKKFNN